MIQKIFTKYFLSLYVSLPLHAIPNCDEKIMVLGDKIDSLSSKFACQDSIQKNGNDGIS